MPHACYKRPGEYCFDCSIDAVLEDTDRATRLMRKAQRIAGQLPMEHYDIKKKEEL